MRRALRNAGRNEAVIDLMLDELRRAFAAIEKTRGRIDDELVWALLAMQCDRYRRAAHEMKRGVIA